MSLVVFQHVDLLGELAVTLLTLVLFNALVKLHVVPQRVLCLHACGGKSLLSAGIGLTVDRCAFICRLHSGIGLRCNKGGATLRRGPDLSRTLRTGSLGCRREL